MAVNTVAFYMNYPNGAQRQPAMVPTLAPSMLWGQGTPDGANREFKSVAKGSLYIQVDATSQVDNVWVKVGTSNVDADWILQSTVPNAPVNATASTLAVTKAAHANRTVTLNRAAGIAVTLPAATGTGDKYRFVVGTTFTGAASIAVPNATNYMIGTALLFADSGDTCVGFATANSGTVATESDTISLFGTANAQGGIKGEVVELEDVASAVWHVRLVSDAGGTEASPFSAAV